MGELRIQLVLQFGVDVSAPWTVQLPYNLVLTVAEYACDL